VEILCLKIKTIDEISLYLVERIRVRDRRNGSLNIRNLRYAACAPHASFRLLKMKTPPPENR